MQEINFDFLNDKSYGESIMGISDKIDVLYLPFECHIRFSGTIDCISTNSVIP